MRRELRLPCLARVNRGARIAGVLGPARVVRLACSDNLFTWEKALREILACSVLQRAWAQGPET